MEVILSGHGAYKLQYHIVWVCKYRRRILKPAIQTALRHELSRLLRSMPGVTVETIGFGDDYLHMVMTIPPRYAIAEAMEKLKSQSASALRAKFPWLKKVYWKENIVWSPGYFVSSVGLDEQTIRNYVKNQGQRDEGQLKLTL